MDENALEQTQLLRNIWNEMKSVRSDLKGEIAALRTELKTELKTEIGSVRTELQHMNTRMAAFGFRLGNVEGTLVQLQGTVRELADQHWTLTNVVKRVVERQDESIGNLRERVTRIESKPEEDE